MTNVNIDGYKMIVPQSKCNLNGANIFSCKCDFKRKFRLGTKFIDEIGIIYKYVKIDAGIVGKDEKGKSIKNIFYGWMVTHL